MTKSRSWIESERLVLRRFVRLPEIIRESPLPHGSSMTMPNREFGWAWGELIGRVPGEVWKTSSTVSEVVRKVDISACWEGIYE